MIVFTGEIRLSTTPPTPKETVRVSVTEANGVVVERHAIDAEGGVIWLHTWNDGARGPVWRAALEEVAKLLAQKLSE